jgi:hypothetical protein
MWFAKWVVVANPPVFGLHTYLGVEQDKIHQSFAKYVIWCTVISSKFGHSDCVWVGQRGVGKREKKKKKWEEERCPRFTF